MLARLGLTDRAGDLAETLSGGLRRRVELAKGMLHTPRLLLLDEPSTGLDPAARAEMWDYLEGAARHEGVTILLTTHLLEEADRVDRMAILDQGRLVALDTPDNLRRTVGGDTITIAVDAPHDVAASIHSRFDVAAQVVEDRVRLELSDGHNWIARLVEAFPGQIRSITLSQPTLEDVFIAKTGHRFWDVQPEPAHVASH
jgi:ABC-2 type transport system ATP-binding protein